MLNFNKISQIPSVILLGFIREHQLGDCNIFLQSIIRYSVRLLDTMSFFQKAADIGHKTVVTGLMGLFVYSFVEIGSQVIEARNMNSQISPQEEYKMFLKEKVDEERKKAEDPGALFVRKKDDYE